MVKDTRDKVIALGAIGAVIGGIVSLALNLIKLIGMVIGFALSLVGIPVNFILSLIGLKVALACLVLGLIGAIIISRQVKSPLIKKIIVPPIIICGIILIGYVAGFVLNFISSSPLIMGGTIGFIYPALLILLSVLLSRNPDKENGIFGEVLKDSKAFFIKLGIVTVIGTAVGVGLGVAVSAVFPNVMLGMWSIALASAVIGAIVFPIEIFIGNLSAINKLGTFIAKLITPSSKENKPSKSLGEILANLAEENKSMSEVLASLTSSSSKENKPMNEVLASLDEGNKPSKQLSEVLASLDEGNKPMDEILANLTSSSSAAFSTR
ncbi:hypothetical protein [Wolbachia endosymbiont of Oedothorax gibbosus]|uniref:hypothetical protein n=1 Tax=Wolbachia endosymbiont of Oedothorax gibbosus TaxID=931100 RepID=UPI002024168E|nr:hypothetical protein [Wolbachia endosymbiont of Oedothorax gibbosus]